MWIFTQYGFYSVVEDRNDDRLVYVRSRSETDLQRFVEVARTQCGIQVKENAIVELQNADYRYRILISKELLGMIMRVLSEGIDYDNFKDRVAEVDKERAHTYMDVWSVMRWDAKRNEPMLPELQMNFSDEFNPTPDYDWSE